MEISYKQAESHKCQLGTRSSRTSEIQRHPPPRRAGSACGAGGMPSPAVSGTARVAAPGPAATPVTALTSVALPARFLEKQTGGRSDRGSGLWRLRRRGRAAPGTPLLRRDRKRLRQREMKRHGPDEAAIPRGSGTVHLGRDHPPSHQDRLAVDHVNIVGIENVERGADQRAHVRIGEPSRPPPTGPAASGEWSPTGRDRSPRAPKIAWTRQVPNYGCGCHVVAVAQERLRENPDAPDLCHALEVLHERVVLLQRGRSRNLHRCARLDHGFGQVLPRGPVLPSAIRDALYAPRCRRFQSPADWTGRPPRRSAPIRMSSHGGKCSRRWNIQHLRHR